MVVCGFWHGKLLLIENMSALIQMFVLFSIVVIGFFSGRIGLIDIEFCRKLSKLIINLTCPCLILSSTMGGVLPDRTLILPLLGISVITYLFLLLLAYSIPRFMSVKSEERGIYSFMLAFGNVGFIGYPVVSGIFGPEAVFYASVLNMINTICVFVWGVRFVAGVQQGVFKWRSLFSPALIATYLSIIIVALGWQAPRMVAEPLILIGAITVPGSLLIIGNSINNIPLHRMVGSPILYFMTFMRLLVFPLLILYVFRFFGFDSLAVDINTMIIAMPVASFGTMFCLRYGKDDTLMTQGTFISTLFSLLSIPFLTMLVD